MLSYLFSPFGRIRRRDWWLYVAINFFVICALITYFIYPAMTPGLTENQVGALLWEKLMSPAFLILWAALWWSGLCANIKRYHDRGKSGFWVLICFIPIVGPIWQFIELGFCSGDEDENVYGSPPGSETRSSAFEKELAGLKGTAAARINDDYFQVNAAKAAAPVPRPRSFGAAQQPMFGKRA